MSLASFGVRNPVPANLLMFAAVAVGLFSALTLRREFFPEVEPDTVTVRIVYPGASPEEIEESMIFKTEDAIADVDRVKRIRTSISEGFAGIIVEFEDGADIDKSVEEIERAIERLRDLPDDAERIQVLEIVPNMPVININLWADVDEEELKRGIRVIEDDLKSLPEMGSMLKSGVREYEIRIEVDPVSPLEHGLPCPRSQVRSIRGCRDTERHPEDGRRNHQRAGNRCPGTIRRHREHRASGTGRRIRRTPLRSPAS